MSVRVYDASWCSSGHREGTQIPPCEHSACSGSKMKTIIQSSVNRGGLKRTGLKPINDGFLDLPICIIAKEVRLQPVPCSRKKSPKKRAGEVRSFHVPRTPSAQTLRKLLNVLRCYRKKDLAALLTPFATHTRTSHFSGTSETVREAQAQCHRW